MKKSERAERHFRIFYLIAGRLFATPEPLENLPLGEGYELRISSLNERRNEMFVRRINDLNKLSSKELVSRFSSAGRPTSDEALQWVESFKTEVQDAFSSLKKWYIAPLFRTSDLADFDYWSKSEFLSVDEIVWLSVGLEPKEAFIGAIKEFDAKGNVQKLDSEAIFVSRHKEIIRRKFDRFDKGNTPSLAELSEWIEAVDLKVHSQFKEILATRASKVARNEPRVEQLSTVAKKDDQREIDKVAQLFTAMAIELFDYKPQASRSPVPKDIVELAASMGMKIGEDTVRKYLRHGATFIPSDWEPHKR